ncbi:MAG TPA: DNA methyltransferase, partial [Luteolibacter sp.]|nr:DNA methyltransferase [Luteolibacter sp.]
MQEATPEQIDAFIARWEKSGGHERGSGQQFLLEFCELLGLEKPSPPVAENERNAYTFERRVDRRKPDGSSAPNWIDLYKSAHFVLETKQGVNPRRDKSDPDQPLLPDPSTATPNKSLGHGHRGSAAWDKALDRAHAQGERYIHLLPPEEGRPPFLIVCDVGHCFDLYAEFSGTGGQYEPFPTPRKRRVLLKDLHDSEIRERFRKIWHDPHSLDPSKYAAKVTREVARALADLAKSLEKDGHDPQVTAGFLQRCLFTMFAEDVGLLPKESFFGMLVRVKDNPAGLVTSLQTLWKDMATGSDFSLAIHDKIPHFNGGLFQDATALPLRSDQIVYLIHAAKQDWSAVEPAIFGTLLERALDPRERHKLGAHYTPRSYVERLVRPTVIDPLRTEWEAVKIAAAQLDDQGKTRDARKAVETFHHKLAGIRVLDPACGSGNFLYVALELLKRLEAEVLDLFEALGGDRRLEMDTTIIRPGNFLGIELNPRAAAIAQLVLWIGYFQWHQRVTGKADTNDRPLLPKDNTIECRDAVLAYDEKIPRRDPDSGEIMTIWDGRTTKPHPVTGKEVPDESARTVLFDYVKPRRAEWPQADYIAGNPPFLGKGERMRGALGDGYVEAIRKAWKGDVPDSADFVMFWWCKAAAETVQGRCKRFGFITTNSIHQTFNRRVIEPFLSDAKKPLHLAYAIPDHPWVDSADGAAVRISMTVASPGKAEGILDKVIQENVREDGENEVTLARSVGILAPNLQIGADLTSARPLLSNSNISSMGMMIRGSGFIVTPEEAQKISDSHQIAPIIKPYVNGKDLLQTSRAAMIIDSYGMSENELAERFPAVYQHLLLHVKPERDASRDKQFKELWWLFGRWRPQLRAFTADIPRYLVTVETAKHRLFTFLDSDVVADHRLITFGFNDSYYLGVFSSRLNVAWALASGGRLEDRPVYNKTRCFETFP